MEQSEKRRDSKRRILRTGESQCKDGRYVYKYLDEFGAPQFVYSWKLEPTDKPPSGKKEDISLREKEIQTSAGAGADCGRPRGVSVFHQGRSAAQRHALAEVLRLRCGEAQ